MVNANIILYALIIKKKRQIGDKARKSKTENDDDDGDEEDVCERTMRHRRKLWKKMLPYCQQKNKRQTSYKVVIAVAKSHVAYANTTVLMCELDCMRMCV